MVVDRGSRVRGETEEETRREAMAKEKAERGAEEQGNGGLLFQLYLDEQGNPPSCGH